MLISSIRILPLSSSDTKSGHGVKYSRSACKSGKFIFSYMRGSYYSRWFIVSEINSRITGGGSRLRDNSRISSSICRTKD